MLTGDIRVTKEELLSKVETLNNLTVEFHNRIFEWQFLGERSATFEIAHAGHGTTKIEVSLMDPMTECSKVWTSEVNSPIMIDSHISALTDILKVIPTADDLD